MGYVCTGQTVALMVFNCVLSLVSLGIYGCGVLRGTLDLGFAYRL